jgi:hypothetical protein
MKGSDREKREKAGKSSHACIHRVWPFVIICTVDLGGAKTGAVKAAAGKEHWDGRRKVK